MMTAQQYEASLTRLNLVRESNGKPEGSAASSRMVDP
jgi:hypothetical protein